MREVANPIMLYRPNNVSAVIGSVKAANFRIAIVRFPSLRMAALAEGRVCGCAKRYVSHKHRW